MGSQGVALSPPLLLSQEGESLGHRPADSASREGGFPFATRSQNKKPDLRQGDHLTPEERGALECSPPQKAPVALHTSGSSCLPIQNFQESNAFVLRSTASGEWRMQSGSGQE
jgi:hypothetical protein